MKRGHSSVRTVYRYTAQPKGAFLVTKTTDKMKLDETLELPSRGENRNCVAVAEVSRLMGKGIPMAFPDLSSLFPKLAEKVLRKPRMPCHNGVIRVTLGIEMILSGPSEQGHISLG